MVLVSWTGSLASRDGDGEFLFSEFALLIYSSGRSYQA